MRVVLVEKPRVDQEFRPPCCLGRGRGQLLLPQPLEVVLETAPIQVSERGAGHRTELQSDGGLSPETASRPVPGSPRGWLCRPLRRRSDAGRAAHGGHSNWVRSRSRARPGRAPRRERPRNAGRAPGESGRNRPAPPTLRRGRRRAAPRSSAAAAREPANVAMLVHAEENAPPVRVRESDEMHRERSVVDPVGFEIDAGVLAARDHLAQFDPGHRSAPSPGRPSTRAWSLSRRGDEAGGGRVVAPVVFWTPRPRLPGVEIGGARDPSSTRGRAPVILPSPLGLLRSPNRERSESVVLGPDDPSVAERDARYERDTLLVLGLLLAGFGHGRTSQSGGLHLVPG